ncbi:hypothetical protein A2686_03925 [Candidatus Woesebacteria bacterium RIFCSPHIGHO2_01_FULL_38_10]|uniref:Phosphoglycerate mutase n=1 Tax=Candidatus Woesebacteria bacterium RIFCSPLOWO2_01_FULL_39_10b TaxID=1802517 RepID=A0A1F8B7H7_9BACT|nr:MAG: hypothetical protein A2686_03925 [Candidatus Woesebacteria bacterium RIFCSPHIGHO2_01_FULL_38_10]OGM59994.1 MAG: hypothetical protein A2892_03805 [Candidatus Woesebacteria bacterium RIFCSPLOWO2_01_FULL_39_10b]
MIYFIFRHAQTFKTKYSIPYKEKIKTARILPEGIPAIKGLSKYLKEKIIDSYYTSPFIRCTQTAKIISQITGRAFVNDERLGEFMEPKETFDQLKSRVQNFLQDLEKEGGKCLAICTHGAVISALKHLITTGIYELENLPDYPDPGILLKIKNKKTNYFDFN